MAAATSTQPQPYLSQHQQQAYTTPPNSQGHPQYSLINHNQNQYSPRGSHAHNGSPNSPASPYYAHQQQSQSHPPDFPYNLNLAHARKDKQHQPQYIPAALRPTDRPLRSHPLTPPRSLHGSSDSLADKKGRPINRPSRPSSHRSTTSTTNPSFPTTSPHTSTTRPTPPKSTDDLLSHIPASTLTTTFSPSSLADLPPLTTAPPTRAHWKADANSPVCDFPICQTRFSLFERRHHCRRCGNVFCAEHSAEKLPLDQNGDFHPRGEKVRGCEGCAREWVEWVEGRVRRGKDGSTNQENGAGNGGAMQKKQGPMALMMAGSGKRDGSYQAAEQKGPAVVAGSVPGNWSTF